MRQLGFFVDSAACSGCKACAMACRDRNNLPPGVRWRRVYEVGGGGWRREGEAWVPEIAVYNLSIACNHCEKPLCLDGCPARAIAKREDGIVVIDPAKCLGCRYCEWACPYGAPQFDEAAGVMTKCDLCAGLIERGGRPACVAACPMRALDFGEIEELRAKYGTTAEAHPLPKAEITEPALVIRPHRDAAKAKTAAALIKNREEV
ncbi:MAG: dimethylsulfoxide reductase subunit B [Candidatus Aminicenantes bacterium]|nr:dimethylsulfoxide reductase subunit B [Candidatus Aminicenantes bacterium]